MSQIDQGAEKLFESLCKKLDEELERQENVQRLCQAQGNAAKEHDSEGLEAHTQSLSILVSDSVNAEQSRIEASRELVAHLGLPADAHTLSDLIAVAPEPWKHRMADFQTNMKTVLASTQASIKDNAGYIRRALKIINNAVDMFVGEDRSQQRGYDAGGKEAVATKVSPALIDAQG